MYRVPTEYISSNWAKTNLFSLYKGEMHQFLYLCLKKLFYSANSLANLFLSFVHKKVYYCLKCIFFYFQGACSLKTSLCTL